VRKWLARLQAAAPEDLTVLQSRSRPPLVRPAPLEEVQTDVKAASTVPADPEGKRQQVVEVCNSVDAGTSLLLSAQVHADFHAETAFEAVLTFLRAYGRPKQLTFDRDPRWVGSASGRDPPPAATGSPPAMPPSSPPHPARALCPSVHVASAV
jgi:hypothetical protein